MEGLSRPPTSTVSSSSSRTPSGKKRETAEGAAAESLAATVAWRPITGWRRKAVSGQRKGLAALAYSGDYPPSRVRQHDPGKRS